MFMTKEDYRRLWRDRIAFFFRAGALCAATVTVMLLLFNIGNI